MFVLAEPGAPVWMDVAEGIRIAFRPPGTECLAAGRRAAREAVRADVEADAGVAFVYGCARWGAAEWEGIGDADGQVLPISPHAVVMLLSQRPDIYQAVDDAYVGPLLELLSEKKGSSPSPTGISDRAGPPIATPAPSAPKKKRTARSAPTGKTSRAPKLAKPSGPSSAPVAGS